MLRKRKQARWRISLAEIAQGIGPRLHTAFRHGRAALWRFKRSPERQDRAAMFATFAFIAVFAVGSVDAIITGGADFTPGTAYAAEYAAHRVTATTLPVPAAELLTTEEVTPEDALKSAGEIDYSFTTEVLLGGPEESLAIAEPVTEDAETAETLKAKAMAEATEQAGLQL